MKELKEIEIEIKKILKGYPNAKIPLFDIEYSDDKTIVEIEHVYSDDYYILSFCEHGKKNELIKTKELNEFIFEICKTATWDIAYNFGLSILIESIDKRILWFAKQIDILQSLPLEEKYLKSLKIKFNELLKLNLF